MDTTDPDIFFDENGVCDHCNNFYKNVESSWLKKRSNDAELNKHIAKIKKDGEGKDFDCIIGVSGGIDSSYLTFLAKKEFQLRPLIFHVDAGWNSQVAVNNIERLVTELDLDLYTEVIDWSEMRDLQLAFIKSGVSHIDAPQDQAYFATMYKFANKYNIKHILTGANLSTECVRNPIEWMYFQSDTRQLCDIFNIYGKGKLVNYPLTSILWHKVYLPYFKNIKVFRLLDYVEYNKKNAEKILINEIGWQPYSRKHFESRFTSFYEGYWLFEKFGYDTRRVQLSSLILTGQLTRSEAITQLELLPYAHDSVKHEIEYVAKKLNVSSEELLTYFNQSNKSFRDYKNQYYIYKLGSIVMKLLGLEVGGKR